MSVLIGEALVAQGGGPTAVINQSLVGVVLEARKFPQVTRVYGALNGVRGIVNQDFLDLTQETAATSSRWHSPLRAACSRPGTSPTRPIAGRCSRSWRPTMSGTSSTSAGMIRRTPSAS